ncbi:hypothetical protein [Microbacterium allomyrinae]|uniref:hypothetical protein n=1 Tax=Microbacterium allomyrinae TaxID=2830666 RepID=UPI0027E0F6D0|nr:hypothetical protein [Microbacterium allomyrinae]
MTVPSPAGAPFGASGRAASGAVTTVPRPAGATPGAVTHDGTTVPTPAGATPGAVTHDGTTVPTPAGATPGAVTHEGTTVPTPAGATPGAVAHEGTTSTIAAFDARPLRVPLTRAWGAEVTSVGVIATHVVRSDGAEGWGFSWTPQIGAEAVHALLSHDIAAFATGRTADPASLWGDAWRHLHEAGGGGLTTIALAGLDLAL